jgi:hypothetical protein
MIKYLLTQFNEFITKSLFTKALKAITTKEKRKPEIVRPTLKMSSAEFGLVQGLNESLSISKVN